MSFVLLGTQCTLVVTVFVLVNSQSIPLLSSNRSILFQNFVVRRLVRKSLFRNKDLFKINVLKLLYV